MFIALLTMNNKNRVAVPALLTSWLAIAMAPWPWPQEDSEGGEGALSASLPKALRLRDTLGLVGKLVRGLYTACVCICIIYVYVYIILYIYTYYYYHHDF